MISPRIQSSTTSIPSPLGAAAPTNSGVRPAGFDSVLRVSRARLEPEEQTRRAAEEFVAQALVLPILKQVRETNQAAAPFAPGPYEKSIGALFDQETAVKIVRAEGFALVDAVARNLLRNQPRSEPGRQAAPALDGASIHGNTDASSSQA